MIKIKHSSILLLATLLLSACTGGFEEINTNPNEPADADEEYIFAYVAKEAGGEFGLQSSYNITYIQRWIMHTAAVYGNSTMPPYTLFDQYRIQNLWEYYYSNLLLNCTVLEKKTAGDPLKNNKHQVARIWKAYCFHRVTDLWGDVPYTDAFQLLEEGTLSASKASYDSQESIYADLLETLGDAASKIEPEGVFYENDLIFDGDMDQWVRFANSLRLRLAVRSGNESVVQQIIAEDRLMASDDDNALFHYPDNTLYWNPYYELHQSTVNNMAPENSGTSTPKISELMVRQFADNNDLRLLLYARPMEADNKSYRGVPNLMNATLKENQAMGVGVYTTSYIGDYFHRDREAPNLLLTYAEVCFLRAEAALRGWTSENAEEQYNKGVTAAFTQFGLEDTLATQYLAADGAFDNSLEQIITQKWVALYLNGYEAFAEYRRTGFPQLRKWDLELEGIIVKRAEWVNVPREYLPGRLP